MSGKISKSNSFIHNFLINPGYRLWRHIAVILSAVIMSVNQVVMNFQEMIPYLGNKIYIGIFFTFLSYSVIIYLNLHILMPKYLLKRKYAAYLFYISIMILVAIFSQDLIEYASHLYIGKPYEYLPILLSNIPSLFVNLICLGGISIPVYMRNWILYKQKVNQLEKNKVYSEVEHLKEQVNPVFLFDILNRTGLLAKCDPQKASDMLMKLSQLLRYQLYDCNRDKVLLSSEIVFLTNYLDLEKQYSPNFNFSITAEGDTYKIFIPPLLFLTFIQNTIRTINKNEEEGYIKVNIAAIEDEVCLACTAENNEGIILSDPEYEKVKQRLDILYCGNYSLTVANDESTGESTVNLILKNHRA